MLQYCDAFIVNTKYAKNELVDLGCHENKIHIIPQGIYLNDFPYKTRKIDDNKTIRLLTVGRLSIEKGHHIALKAIHLLSNKFPNIEYHIVGDGPRKSELSDLAAQLNLSDKVIFHGFLTGRKLIDIFDIAHIFLLPSINNKDGYLVETQGVVLQEAQASGIPVIGSRTGGIPDVIDHMRTGILFDDSDFETLADYTERLILDTPLYEDLSIAGRKDVEERFDIDKVCLKLLKLYNRFIL